MEESEQGQLICLCFVGGENMKKAMFLLAAQMFINSLTFATPKLGAKVHTKVADGRYIDVECQVDRKVQDNVCKISFKNHSTWGFCGGVYIYVYGKDNNIVDAHRAVLGCVHGTILNGRKGVTRVFGENGVYRYHISNRAMQETRGGKGRMQIVSVCEHGDPVKRLFSNIKIICEHFKSLPSDYNICKYLKK